MGMSCDSKYQVTPEGLVFTIQDDGTIKKIANISPDGSIEPIGARKTVQKEVDLTEIESEEENNGSSGLKVFFIVILIVGLICAVVYIVQCENNKNYLNSRIYNLENENRGLKDKKQSLENEKQSLENEKNILASEKQNLESELKVWADEYPIIIKDIQVRNQGEEYDKTIYSKDTTYIYPQIVYKSLDSRSIKLDVKFWDSYGKVRTGTGSKGGYSYSDSVRVYKGDGAVELSGWGNKNKGYWSAGRYRYEIWCNGKMLKDKVFYIK